jgi:hypothetical protein
MREAAHTSVGPALFLSPDAEEAKARARSWKEPRAFYMLARIRARSPCLYARNTRRCPVLRAGCMRASEETYRLYSCGRCAQQVRICRDCDRGNQYCAGECARMRRRESLHRAAQRYQRSYRGACRHAARQRVWRERHVQKVTHQGSLGTVGALIVAATSTTTPGSDADSARVAAQPHATVLELAKRRVPARWPVHRRALARARCCFCGRVLARFARLGPLRGGP